MKKVIGMCAVVLTVLLLCVYVNAESDIEIYNRGEKVETVYDVVYKNEKYYINLVDLPALGLDVDTETDKTYKITSNDCLGKEHQVLLTRGFSYIDISNEAIITIPSPVTPVKVPSNFDITNSETPPLIIIPGDYISEFPPSVTVSIKRRNTKQIGEPYLNKIWNEKIPYYESSDTMLFVDDEAYVSADLIGEVLSHEYSISDNRIDFYITDEKRFILDTTVNLVDGEIAPDGGIPVDIYIAKKTGEGSSLEDFDILVRKSTIIPKGESAASCMIEASADKISSDALYYIADYGDRYFIRSAEYTLSNTGNVIVFAQRKYIAYKAKINLPEADETDVLYTVYVKTKYGTFSMPGVVKSGETSAITVLYDLPPAANYTVWIEFNNHKYKNAYLNNILSLPRPAEFAIDFGNNFTASYSKEILCTVRLPDEYICTSDVELTLKLENYYPPGDSSVVVVQEVHNGDDTLTVKLNNEQRVVEIPIYGNSDIMKLTYQLNENIDGLYPCGYLGNDGYTACVVTPAKQLTCSQAVEITLIKGYKISGKVETVDPDLIYTVTVVGKLADGNTKEFTASPDSLNFCTDIPENVISYTMNVKTNLNVINYYVENGKSSYNVNDSSVITDTKSRDDFILKYVVQNPTLPVKITLDKNTSWFVFSRVSDYPVGNFKIYFAYYDEHSNLIKTSTRDITDLKNNINYDVLSSVADNRIKKIKAFALSKDSLVPLGNVVEAYTK